MLLPRTGARGSADVALLAQRFLLDSRKRRAARASNAATRTPPPPVRAPSTPIPQPLPTRTGGSAPPVKVRDDPIHAPQEVARQVLLGRPVQGQVLAGTFQSPTPKVRKLGGWVAAWVPETETALFSIAVPPPRVLCGQGHEGRVRGQERPDQGHRVRVTRPHPGHISRAHAFSISLRL